MRLLLLLRLARNGVALRRPKQIIESRDQLCGFAFADEVVYDGFHVDGQPMHVGKKNKRRVGPRGSNLLCNLNGRHVAVQHVVAQDEVHAALRIELGAGAANQTPDMREAGLFDQPTVNFQVLGIVVDDED